MSGRCLFNLVWQFVYFVLLLDLLNDAVWLENVLVDCDKWFRHLKLIILLIIIVLYIYSIFSFCNVTPKLGIIYPTSKNTYFSFSVGMNVVVRYWFLKEVFRQKKFADDVIPWQKCNIVGAIIGIISALGISMVANFQVLFCLFAFVLSFWTMQIDILLICWSKELLFFLSK